MKLLLSFVLLLACGTAFAQVVMPSVAPRGPLRLLSSDSAVLDSQEPKSDFPCIVTPVLPELDFDLRFHVGYVVSIPMTELEGGENMITILFRVIPENGQKEPVYFFQRFQVPEIKERATGKAGLSGEFRVGEGKYHVDWVMRDKDERICASFWDIDARPNAKDNLLPGSVVRNVVEAQDPTFFADEADESRVERDQRDAPLHVKIIVNFSPQRVQSAKLGDTDLEAVVGILRKIAREPRIGRYSVVATSIQSQQVIYRQESAPHIDFPALGKELKSLNFGTVDLKQLAVKNSETAFFEKLITNEMRNERTDALIFVGPKYYLDTNVTREALERLRGLDPPVFYLNYNPHPLSEPWRDAIGKVVRQLQGIEYTISRPRDLCSAWPSIMQRLLKGQGVLSSSNSTF